MLNSDRKTIAGGIMWWFAAFGLILLTHLGVETIAYYFLNSPIKAIFNPILYEKDSLLFTNIVMPARGILFIISLTVLIYPVLAGVINQNLTGGGGFSNSLQSNYHHNYLVYYLHTRSTKWAGGRVFKHQLGNV